MSESVADLLEQVREECGFDLTAAQVLRALNQKHRRMVTDSMCFTRSSSFNTVAGTAAYALPAGAVVVLELTVDGVRWERVGRDAIQSVAAGLGALRGSGGVYAEDFTSAGEPQVLLYPTPDDVHPVAALAAVRPDDLAADGAADSIRIPPEYNEDLVAGTIGVLLARTDQRPEAGVFTQQCDVATEKLRRQVKRRLRSGVGQVRVVGYHV